MPRNRVGTIVRRGDAWWVKVQRHGVTRTATVHGSRVEAELTASRLAAELGASDAWAKGVTLSEWYGMFRETDSNRGYPRDPSTLRWYDRALEVPLGMLGGELLASLTHEQIAEAVRRSPSPENSKRALRAVLRSAYDMGLMPSKPMERRIHTHAEKRPRQTPWSPQEVSEALERIPSFDPMMGVYLALGLSGLRRGEAMGMRWEDIRDGMLHVLWTYSDANGHRPKPKNSNSERWVPLFPLLGDFMESQRVEGRCIPLDESGFHKRWKRAQKVCGLRIISPKMLRHTSDTLMLQAGVSPDLNALMHGRSDPTTTYRHYFRPSEDDMREAMERIVIRLDTETGRAGTRNEGESPS